MGIITIIPLISFILYSFILMIILTSNKTKLSKAFSLYIIAMIVWSVGSFLMKTKIPPSSEFWNRILLVGLISVPVFLLRFSYVMTESYHKMKIIKFGYISSVILIISGFLNFVTYDVQWVEGVFTYKLGYGSYIMAIIGSAFYVLALANIIIQVKRNEIPLKRVRFVIVGLSLVIIGALLNFNTFIGQFGVDIILNLINALLITYSIYRNKFLKELYKHNLPIF